jgi:curved DNA-binding protein CbpA
VPNFYQLLSVEPTATPEEIKRAFRSEIARYHPDKVQHLGKEFQEMAASRAAALTEAYRTLMDAALRAEYDQGHLGVPEHGADSSTTRSTRFASELRDRDDFVRRATLGRFRTALAAEVGTAEEVATTGFDLAFTVKSKKLFSRHGSQHFAVKIVPSIDKAAVQDAWNAAQKTTPICVYLMGSRLASAKELSAVIADLRKRSRGGVGISVIPIDVRDWSAHIPSDVPDSCRNVLKRLRDASSV